MLIALNPLSSPLNEHDLFNFVRGLDKGINVLGILMYLLILKFKLEFFLLKVMF